MSRYRIHEPLLLGEESGHIRFREAAIETALKSLDWCPVFICDGSVPNRPGDMLVGYARALNSGVVFYTLRELDHENLRPWFSMLSQIDIEENRDVEIDGRLDSRLHKIAYIGLLSRENWGGWLEKLNDGNLATDGLEND